MTTESLKSADVIDPTVSTSARLLEGLPSSQKERNLKGLKFLELPNRDESQTQSNLDSRYSETLDARTIPMFSVPPKNKPVKEYFSALQKWEGFVIEVGDDVFRARLIPIAGEGPDQEAGIYISEISDGDRSLLRPGAVFYWSIGYLERPSGRIRASIIRFRRLPRWTTDEISEGESKVHALRDLLGE